MDVDALQQGLDLVTENWNLALAEILGAVRRAGEAEPEVVPVQDDPNHGVLVWRKSDGYVYASLRLEPGGGTLTLWDGLDPDTFALIG